MRLSYRIGELPITFEPAARTTMYSTLNHITYSLKRALMVVLGAVEPGLTVRRPS